MAKPIENKSFKKYKSDMKKAIKIINAELKMPDTNFKNILANLNLMSGRTQNFI